jgi:hypothetical protein
MPSGSLIQGDFRHPVRFHRAYYYHHPENCDRLDHFHDLMTHRRPVYELHFRRVGLELTALSSATVSTLLRMTRLMYAQMVKNAKIMKKELKEKSEEVSVLQTVLARDKTYGSCTTMRASRPV